MRLRSDVLDCELSDKGALHILEDKLRLGYDIDEV